LLPEHYPRLVALERVTVRYSRLLGGGWAVDRFSLGLRGMGSRYR